MRAPALGPCRIYALRAAAATGYNRRLIAVRLLDAGAIYFQGAAGCNLGYVDEECGAGSCAKTLQEVCIASGFGQRRLEMTAARGCAIATAPTK